ncbi:protocatechuate 3,4-dioxygenase subunit beta [Pelagibius sp. CAU 1746]|uniref:protocatechuate 3,4-dioxygenase subunit beta n=1 Tax=Pelagibius sp. CAU 1746 TaxID=3140370 RepID=UPI00325B3834
MTDSPKPYAPRDWGSHPPLIAPDYKSTNLRGATKPLVPIKQSLSELTGPVFGQDSLGEFDNDLTRNGRKDGAAPGEPLGERIIVSGKVVDELGRPQPDMLVEVWQANAAGRYVHKVDQHNAPLDPNFFGGGRCVTDDQGVYRFYTVKPGAYPWGNHPNAWRPNHIHFSLFGPSLCTRLVTQMYFPGDPLLDLDPIFLATPEKARGRLVSEFDLSLTEPDFALGYRFDIVLRGPRETPMETA